MYIARHSGKSIKITFTKQQRKADYTTSTVKTESHIPRKEISDFWIPPQQPINPLYHSPSLTKTPFTRVEFYYQYTQTCKSNSKYLQPQIQRFYTSYNTVTIQCTWYKTHLCSFVANPIVTTKLVFHNSRNGLPCYVDGTTVGFLFQSQYQFCN